MGADGHRPGRHRRLPGRAARTHEETVIVTPAWEEKVITPAVPEVHEVTKTVTVVDTEAWDETVVAENGYAYVQKQTGKLRYRDSGCLERRGQRPRQRLRLVPCPRARHDDGDPPRRRDPPGEGHRHARLPGRPRGRPHRAPRGRHPHRHRRRRCRPSRPSRPRRRSPTPRPPGPATRTPPPPARDGSSPASRSSTPPSTHLATSGRAPWSTCPRSMPCPRSPRLSHPETVVDEAEVAAWDEQVLESEATPAGPACPTAVLDATAPVAGSAHPRGVHPPRPPSPPRRWPRPVPTWPCPSARASPSCSSAAPSSRPAGAVATDRDPPHVRGPVLQGNGPSACSDAIAGHGSAVGTMLCPGRAGAPTVPEVRHEGPLPMPRTSPAARATLGRRRGLRPAPGHRDHRHGADPLGDDRRPRPGRSPRTTTAVAAYTDVGRRPADRQHAHRPGDDHPVRHGVQRSRARRRLQRHRLAQERRHAPTSRRRRTSSSRHPTP